MSDLNEPHPSAAGEANYQDILTAIVKRFIRLVGVAGALRVARRVPSLLVDDEGNVLDYDKDNSLRTVTMLIDEYSAIFGSSAATLAHAAMQPLVPTSETWPSDELPEIGLPHSTIAPSRLLLVDDHVLFRHGLTRLLDPQPDFKVVGEAATVQEAVTLTRELKPDLVLMDISLPDGSGLDATLVIMAEQPATKIVFLTVHDEDETLFAAIRAGGVGYLPKSISAAELISRLRGVNRGEAAISPVIARRILQEFSHLSSESDPNAAEPMDLTAREAEILRALAGGATNRQIADQLVISEHTVKNHVKRILAKLHLHSRRDAARYARRHGLAPPFDDHPE